jgi:hypothetical protein
MRTEKRKSEQKTLFCRNPPPPSLFSYIFFVDSTTTTTTTTTMATGISDETIAIVKATAPLVKENVEKITSTFYPKMLGRHPVRKERVIELPIYIDIVLYHRDPQNL